MTEHDQKVARINALARKSKVDPLSEDELAEQKTLRRWYIDACKASLRGHLEHIRPADEAPAIDVACDVSKIEE